MPGSYTKGAAMPNTGVPGIIGGFGKERVLHAPAAGEIHCISKIADIVEKDQVLAWIGDTPVRASLTGVLRGMIRDGFTVPKGMKIADIDPRKEQKKKLFHDFRQGPLYCRQCIGNPAFRRSDAI